MLAGAQDGANPGFAPVPASAADDRIRISLFKPPPGSVNEPAIMIVQKGSHPVEALMTAHIKP